MACLDQLAQRFESGAVEFKRHFGSMRGKASYSNNAVTTASGARNTAYSRNRHIIGDYENSILWWDFQASS